MSRDCKRIDVFWPHSTLSICVGGDTSNKSNGISGALIVSRNNSGLFTLLLSIVFELESSHSPMLSPLLRKHIEGADHVQSEHCAVSKKCRQSQRSLDCVTDSIARLLDAAAIVVHGNLFLISLGLLMWSTHSDSPLGTSKVRHTTR